MIDRLYQQGSSKLRLPRTHDCEAVLLNTAGGVTGGDRFAATLEAAPHTSLTVATQTAERLYRSAGGTGIIENSLKIGAEARIDWLPQETIAFEGFRLRRTLHVDMAQDAALLAIEPLILGRTAMKETVMQGGLVDQWRVHRAGQLVYADALRLEGAIPDTLAPTATMGGAIACASLLYVAPDAEDRIAQVRAALGRDGAASAWNGLIAGRIVAKTGAALRKTLIAAIEALRAKPLPRVWSI